MSIQECAHKLIEDIISGHTTYVVQTLNRLPQKQALAVVVHMVHYFPGAHSDMVRFLHAIERNAD